MTTVQQRARRFLYLLVLIAVGVAANVASDIWRIHKENETQQLLTQKLDSILLRLPASESEPAPSPEIFPGTIADADKRTVMNKSTKPIRFVDDSDSN